MQYTTADSKSTGSCHAPYASYQFQNKTANTQQQQYPAMMNPEMLSTNANANNQHLAGTTAQYNVYALQQQQLAQGLNGQANGNGVCNYEGSYGNLNMMGSGSNYGASHPTSPWTTTRTGSFAQMNTNLMASQNSAVSTCSSTEQTATTRVEGKKYRHNPYASSEASTPPASPMMSASHSTQSFYDTYGAAESHAAPVYDQNVLAGVENNSMPAMSLPASNSLEEQYTSIIGNIAPTACSARGRTLLLNIIRLQHLDKIQTIFEELCLSFSAVISDPQGCHVLRFIVEYLQEGHLDMLCSIMTPELAYQMCTLSQHSRRVLQCLVEHHKSLRLQPLIEVICANNQAIAIAKTQQGCIAIMRILENVVAPLKDMVFHAIAPAFAQLAVDQFGNYTVQTAIQTVDRVVLSSTIEQVLYGQFVSVSCNKFGSNVMEKVVQAASPSLTRVLLNELCYEPLNLSKLINDGFGNFVIQAMVESTASTPEGRRLCDTIRPLLQSSPYGHKIEAKLRSKRLLGSVSNDNNIRSNSTQASSSSGSTCGDR